MANWATSSPLRFTCEQDKRWRKPWPRPRITYQGIHFLACDLVGHMRKVQVHRIQCFVDVRYKHIPRVSVSCEFNLESVIGSCAPTAESALSIRTVKSAARLPLTASMHFSQSLSATSRVMILLERAACRKRRCTSFEETMRRGGRGRMEEKTREARARRDATRAYFIGTIRGSRAPRRLAFNSGDHSSCGHHYINHYV